MRATCSNFLDLLNKTFDDIFMPLEQSLATLDYGFKKARHFAFTYPYSPYHTAYPRVIFS